MSKSDQPSDVVRDMAPLIHTIVPAQPNYECIEVSTAGVMVQRFQVVAWAITNSMVAVPITTDMNANVRFVRSPLGDVTDQKTGIRWKSIDSFAEDMKRSTLAQQAFTTRGMVNSVE